MRLTMAIHRDFRCDAVDSIEVDAVRSPGGELLLTYVAEGDLSDLLLPPQGAPERRDRLWQHTCFEIFIRSAASEAYYEFNFSPSGEWAAYRFDGRRVGMRNVNIPSPPIETETRRGFELRSALDLGKLSDLPRELPWHVGLSAVIEEKNGCKSYWALAHPPGEPDFHHPACFALQLPPAA